MQAVRPDAFDGLKPVANARPRPAETSDEMDRLGLPLVMVEWQDAWFDFDLAGPGETRNDYLVRTVGFLVAEGPRFVSLAQEVLPDGDGFRAVTHIPLPVVERLIHLDPHDGLATD